VCSRRTTSQPNNSIAANTVSDPAMAKGSPTSCPVWMSPTPIVNTIVPMIKAVT